MSQLSGILAVAHGATAMWTPLELPTRIGVLRGAKVNVIILNRWALAVWALIAVLPSHTAPMTILKPKNTHQYRLALRRTRVLQQTRPPRQDGVHPKVSRGQ